MSLLLTNNTVKVILYLTNQRKEVLTMKANTRAFKERELILLSQPSPTKQQIGYVYGMEKTLLAEDERTPKSELQQMRSEEHTSELQSRFDLVCRLLLEKKKE